MRHVGLLLLCVLPACAGPPEQRGLALVVPTHVGEGHNEGHVRSMPHGQPAGSTNAAAATQADGGDPSARAIVAHGSAPDPVPLSTPHQWDLALHYAKGMISLTRVTAVELPEPMLTPRRVGRFAVELWVGKELVDRVRFDFPLLGADGPPGEDRAAVRGTPRFSPGADTRSTVRVPASDRATEARIVDRLSGETVAIPWPPAPSGS